MAIRALLPDTSTEYLTVNFHVTYDARSRTVGGSIQLTATGPVPNFDAPLTVSRLDWVPGKVLSLACQAAKEKWEKLAEAHEMRHVADIQSIVDSFNQAWKSKTVTGLGVDVAKAKANLDSQLQALASSDVSQIKLQIDASAVQRHKTDTVPLMECDSCP